MSRIDFGSPGFRQGLLELAADRFRQEDVSFVVLVGGLVAGKSINNRAKALKRDSKMLTRQANAIGRIIKTVQRQISALESSPTVTKTQRKKLESLEAELTRHTTEESSLRRQAHRLMEEMNQLAPESLAGSIAKHLPKFTNAKGDQVKLYIVPSPAYDREIGIETAQLLGEKYRDAGMIRILKSGADRLPLRLREHQQYFAELEILTPEKAAWLRGDYYSTPVERVIKDKRKQSSLATAPGISVVGCFGSTITKPKGEATVPYVSVPVLHRIEETTVNENQIGVMTMQVWPKISVPEVRSHPFKDLVSRERSYIGNPGQLNPSRERCINALRTHGPRTTGMLADLTGLSREQVIDALTPLLVKRGDRTRKTWPGLVLDVNSDRWDFSFPWVLEHLRYPEVIGDRKLDSLIGFACLHAGSHDTDYGHFLREVPRAILERQATVLVGAGDFVEGQAHGMMMRQEKLAGSNETDDQELAGKMIAQVMMEAFKPRFEASLSGRDLAALTAAETTLLVRDALVTFCYIPGNHDLWDKYSAHDPLRTMVDTILLRLTRAIERYLLERNLRVEYLLDLVSSKIVTSPDQRFTLPSGLAMSIQHPHMARAKTTSLRPQEMMEKAADCPVVIGANFHVGEVLELWEPVLGQRLCIQIGTMKHGSPFEDGKLKTVDQGFIAAWIESVGGRIVRTSNTFISNEGVVQKRLDPKQPINAFQKQIGLWI